MKTCAAALALVLLSSFSSSVGGCRCNKESEVSVEAMPVKDGRQLIVVKGRKVELPEGSLFKEKVPESATAFDDDQVFFLRASSGQAHAIYFIGEGAYVSPPIDAGTARPPPLDDALGGLFDAAGSRRAELASAVAKEKSDAGVARMLGDSAHVVDKVWDDAFASLSPAGVAEVDKRLASALEPGKPPGALARAVVRIDLRDPAKAKAIAARARELLEPMRAPRANAVLVRALAVSDASEAAAVGCDVLAKKAAGGDDADREILVEAALVALAHAGADCPKAPALLDELLRGEQCRAYFRCNEDGPLSPRTTTKQDEPLCTKEQLSAAIAKELGRTPADVLTSANSTRSPLFAFAVLAAKDKLPESFVLAQARRQYAITQPSEPVCDSDLAPGTACHCDEAVIRDQSCRRSSGGSVHVATCRFEVDDTKKRIFNVAAAAPP